MTDLLNLPDFVVIGAMKAGTSTFHHNFSSHSAFCLSRDKEPNFFLYPSDKVRKKKYSKQFRGPGIRGDVSPSYAKRHSYAGVPERIHEFNPGAKIIYMVRDPVKRIVSHLHHDLLRDRFREENLEKEVLKNPDYIKTSSYFFQIEPFLSIFPKKQIHIIVLEELEKDPEVVLNRLFQFLGLEDSPVPENLNKYNVSDKRYKIKFHDQAHQFLRNRYLGKLYHLFWYFINIKVEKPKLPLELEERIADVLLPDIEQFQAVFPFEKYLWPKFYGLIDSCTKKS